MGDVNWGLLAQYPNAGQAFADSFKQGMQDRQKNIGKAAMAALVKDPTNVNALGALAKVDPEKAMEFRKVQLQYGQKSDEEWKKTIAGAAKMADTPEKWDGIVDQFVAMGHPEAAQLKGKFSPQLRSAYMAQGGVSDDAEHQDPGIIREFDIATQRHLVPQGTTYQQYVTMRNPGMSSPVTIPYGASVSAPGSPDNLPTVSTPEQAHSLPPGTRFRMPDGRIGTVPGGAGGNASGGFPG